jgi:hypothetical protein
MVIIHSDLLLHSVLKIFSCILEAVAKWLSHCGQFSVGIYGQGADNGSGTAATATD